MSTSPEAATDGAGGQALPLRVLDRLTQAMNICGTGLIVALMLLIGADVIGRNVFAAPIAGVPELVTPSIVAIVFLQAPQAMRSGRFPRSDAFEPVLVALAPRAARLLWDLFDLCGAAVMAIIAYATWPILIGAWERMTFIGALGDFMAPIWPVKGTVILGSTIPALQFLASILRRHAIRATP